jgi:hypothetical protein
MEDEADEIAVLKAEISALRGHIFATHWLLVGLLATLKASDRKTVESAFELADQLAIAGSYQDMSDAGSESSRHALAIITKFRDSFFAP